ncbi:MAG: methyltransferase domain-containing protein [Burkholderiales bacterium]|nr:methyltransferase domain-containing protein [Burkholderiales bacterium]
MQWATSIAPGGRVLDLACGAGRHANWLAAQGFQVLAVDIDLGRLGSLPGNVTTMQADLEGAAWPFRGELFEAVVVTNYLHRERFDLLLACVAPNGVLIYETFAVGNERFGKPSNPNFLLQLGELRHRVGEAFEVLGFEEGEVELPRPAVIQRICARRRPI